MVVKGQAEVVSDPAVLERLEPSGLRPYVTTVPRDEWVLIHPNSVTGRRVPEHS